MAKVERVKNKELFSHKYSLHTLKRYLGRHYAKQGTVMEKGIYVCIYEKIKPLATISNFLILPTQDFFTLENLERERERSPKRHDR